MEHCFAMIAKKNFEELSKNLKNNENLEYLDKKNRKFFKKSK